jgi:hypothetical protein
VLASISIRLNAIFWASIGDFLTSFQIFSVLVAIVLAVLKINFMLDVSEIDSIMISTHFDESGVRVFEGLYKKLNTEQQLKTRAVNFDIEVIKNLTQKPLEKGDIEVIKNLTQKPLEKGEITCNKDEIFSYLSKRVITVNLEVIDCMKEWFSKPRST